MRTLPAALAAALQSGATTLARCWIVRRRDGVVHGFTEHDEDVVIDGVVCRSGSGIDGSEVTSRLGFAADAHELVGALADDTLTDDDLAAGRFDGAAVEVWLVDWSAPAGRLKLRAGEFGEVTRAGAAFTVEVRGLAGRLDEARGRLYTATCDADLGDARCGVALAAPAFRAAAAVGAVTSATRLTVHGLASFADDWFTGGRLVWQSGANAGAAVEIKAHRVDAAGVALALWQPPARPVAAGDGFVVTAGCDKRFGTCRSRFGNGANFRGFPHIPGNDVVVRYAVAGEPGNDGSALA
ncbi:DUF2163 domain-containing protein [Blastochloris viridis]|uniref:Gene transfer agent FAD/FMN-containing dehydrogenase n=1 Tax=Blastochloris viridis TaxID=1079 RepID=A0A0H5BCM0_BLAVI|nr:DUF2163 domain-containing protein [Blastochloris viridis]ALK10115.1 hypothetical protein BVIR_2348 [Blastochloris viridis]BAR99957.1 gene transfer agent FAD/FMN-containing dehydrogenase [Blastochloris viridis]CUU42779.1 hypothetical protein BVIRIDIS_17940 [Blastochloris viridis]